MSEAVFTVSDIHCQSCEWTIRTLVGEIDGVMEVVAESATNQVRVIYDDTTISRFGIATALAGAGFPESAPSR
jgi:copper chaperone CopZ